MKKIVFSLMILIVAVSTAALATVAPDPTNISCGARTLALGKAASTLSQDINAIYSNPAGLASISQWQLTSMSGKVLDEFSYLNFAGIYPTNLGNIGVAIVGSFVGDDHASKLMEGTEADPIYEFDYSLAPISYFNNVLLLSYSRSIDNLPVKVDFGTNLKIFSTGISGADITNANGYGNELDMGVIVRPLDYLSIGASARNLLPADMGGKLVYGNGHEESFPVELTTGIALNVLGESGALRQFHGQKVDFLFDIESHPTSADFPMLYHTGVEWSPMSMITIRAGIDQDASEDANGSKITVNNLTAGVGFTYKSFRFDYAYHEFVGAPGTNNSFFSITYGVPFDEPRTDYVKVTSPEDKSILKQALVTVEGTTLEEVRYLAIDDAFEPLQKDGSFTKQRELKIGKNKIKVEGFDVRKNSLETDSIRVCRLADFPDVAPDHWAADQIGYVATLGIINGYPGGDFKPEGSITRAELATLLVRTKKLEDKIEKSSFSDLKLDHWAAPYILRAAKHGIVKGYPDGSFKPRGNITRAEGLAMIARFAGIKEADYQENYPDINDSHWASQIIAGADRAGILAYLQNKMFEPGKSLSRAEAVEMLYRTGLVQDMINNDLLNWDTY
ncbi:MAG: S-layer homology domain-containing protein [Candidatus Margulisiibacteriota bacterium]